jgi:hypothetical protein
VAASTVWEEIEAEARDAFAGEGRFPLPAYSEFMPAPHVVLKPYAPTRAARATTATAGGDDGLDVTEEEQVRELGPGLSKIAGHVLAELERLVTGAPHGLSRALLADNPAWPPELAKATAEATGRGRARGEPLSIALALALSRTQDDKGNVRWTLFGGSHDGPGPAFWRSFATGDRDRFARFVGFATGGAPSSSPSLDGVRVIAEPGEVPDFVRPLLLGDGAPPAGTTAIVTFRPFAELPAPVRQAALAGTVRLVPHPAGLVFFNHPGYRRLAATLPRATQIPLLHLFPRSEDGYGVRIPQSGWLDERNLGAERDASGHRLVHHVARTHRWQRLERDHGTAALKFEDQVSVVLFSTDPDDLGLYGKPMARNAQIWNEGYAPVLDGPRATPLELERAAAAIARGGRYGYRFLYPAMRAGARELFWHRPLVARLDAGATAPTVHLGPAPLLGYVSAEAPPEHPDRPPLRLAPQLLERPGHVEAAALFDHDPGRARLGTARNVRKLLDVAALVGGALTPALASALVRHARHETLAAWLEALPALARDRAGGARCAARLAAAIATPADPPPDLTFAATRTRAFEERLWRTIAALSSGDLRMKETADAPLTNRGKTGGPAARAARLELAHRRDLDRLADHLHDRYRALIEANGMTGRAQVVDQPFHWETDFPFRWSEGWNRNQSREAHERNVVLVIPGRDRGEAVIMADHYDTAYMEDVYETERGGDGLRAAAAGADDNHSATTALLAAAEVLLPLARDGRLARDVWLVHLTGEEFPADCLGARALARAAVERRLRFAAEDGSVLDVSAVRIVGAFVLDMIAHNADRDRDVFQIAPGEGAAAMRLALAAHLANERWNRQAAAWNEADDRRGKGRAARQGEGNDKHQGHGDEPPPPPFAHLALRGEIRPEWDPRSSLYNTDAQIFSDVGIPVVLFMENYDINRTGYHDTLDTMANIDLDYAAALTAIAIETVARTASD